MFVKVVRGSTTGVLEDNINNVLEKYDSEVIDIKVSGAYDGKHESFFAVIMFKE